MGNRRKKINVIEHLVAQQDPVLSISIDADGTTVVERCRVDFDPRHTVGVRCPIGDFLRFS